MKTFLVLSGAWEDQVDIECGHISSYEDQCMEACTRSMENWLSAQSPVGIAECSGAVDKGRLDKGDDRSWGFSNRMIFENVGRPDLAQMFPDPDDENYIDPDDE